RCITRRLRRNVVRTGTSNSGAPHRPDTDRTENTEPTSLKPEAPMRFHGIIPPAVTPMQSNEDVDLPRLCATIDRLLDAGVHGMFVLGTTGEFYALDESEKQAVIATAVAHVNRRVPVIAGTGAETTR